MVFCARSVLTPQNECQATIRALDGNHAGFARTSSVYYRKLARTGERRRSRRSSDTILWELDERVRADTLIRAIGDERNPLSIRDAVVECT